MKIGRIGGLFTVLGRICLVLLLYPFYWVRGRVKG